MADTDKLHNAINSLHENASRIASIGKISEDLLNSQVQFSNGIQQMTDGLGHMDSYQLEILKEVESINKSLTELNKNLVQINTNMNTRLDELKNHVTDTNAKTVNAVKGNRILIVIFSIAVIAVVIIFNLLKF